MHCISFCRIKCPAKISGLVDQEHSRSLLVNLEAAGAQYVILGPLRVEAPGGGCGRAKCRANIHALQTI